MFLLGLRDTFRLECLDLESLEWVRSEERQLEKKNLSVKKFLFKP